MTVTEEEVKQLIDAARQAERNSIIRMIQTAQQDFATSNVLDQFFYDILQSLIDQVKSKK